MSKLILLKNPNIPIETQIGHYLTDHPTDKPVIFDTILMRPFSRFHKKRFVSVEPDALSQYLPFIDIFEIGISEYHHLKQIKDQNIDLSLFWDNTDIKDFHNYLDSRRILDNYAKGTP